MDEENDLATRAGAPRAPIESDLLGQIVAGKYSVRSVLGRGGVGVVYEAENTSLGKLVAIKVLSTKADEDPVAQARFHQEACTAGSLGHPNLCEVYDFGELEDGRPYLVMERLFGRTLREVIRSAGKLRPRFVVNVGAQLAGGLATAHARGVVHRDIKPDNIFVTGSGYDNLVAKVLDFGVAKVVVRARGEDEDDDEVGLTEAGAAPGTPVYMAPEQIVGRPVEERTDVYALGVVLFEMLAGVRPFETASSARAVTEMLTHDAPNVRTHEPDVSVELASLVSRMLARAADERPTAREVRRELLAMMSQGRVTESEDIESILPPPTIRLDQRFRQLAASFGAFTTEFGVSLADGQVSPEESARLREQLVELEKWCRHMRSELAFIGAGPAIPMSRSKPSVPPEGDDPKNGSRDT